jgi:hypothetical protein
LNPPFSKGLPAAFVDKLIAEHSSGRVSAAILLTNAYTANKWWLRAAHAATAICFPNRKINFEREGSETPGGQIFGQSFFYFGSNPAKFFETFGPHGLCAEVKCGTP